MTEPMLKPGSPEWRTTITASKIPAILGVSRWQSQWALWHEMAGLLEPEPVPAAKQEDFDYGHAVEMAAAEFWKWRNPGWRLSRGEVQYSGLDLPFAHAATIDRRASRGRSRRIVEIKKARDREQFGDDGSGNVPVDYYMQVLWQQLETGWTEQPADLVVWFEYGKPAIYRIDHDAEVAAQVIDRVTAWHDSLQARVPPSLDDSVSCYQAVRRMHPDIDGTTAQISADLAADYLGADALLKKAQADARREKTRLLDAMGNAQTAECYGVTIATRSARGKSVALLPKRTAAEEIRALAP